MDESQLYERVMLPAIYYRRADELSDIQIADLISRATAFYERYSPQLAITARADLYAMIDTPSPEHWDRVYDLMIHRRAHEEPQTLWSLVHSFAGHPIDSHRKGEPWALVPSSAQLFLALAQHLGPSAQPDPRELF